MGIRRFLRDRALASRLKIRDTTLVMRKRDATLWAAHAPQNFGYAMRGLFTKEPRHRFHLIAVRPWEGILIASPKVIWLPDRASDFTMLSQPIRRCGWTKPLPEPVECARLDRLSGDPRPVAPDPKEVGKRIRLTPPKVTPND